MSSYYINLTLYLIIVIYIINLYPSHNFFAYFIIRLNTINYSLLINIIIAVTIATALLSVNDFIIQPLTIKSTFAFVNFGFKLIILIIIIFILIKITLLCYTKSCLMNC